MVQMLGPSSESPEVCPRLVSGHRGQVQIRCWHRPDCFLPLLDACFLACFLAIAPLIAVLSSALALTGALVAAVLRLCLLALLVSDMRYAVKRIHVVEYLFLSLVVRYGMSWKLQEKNLLLFSFLATAVFGVHDELLQGIHPLRTYGLRDMAVNGISAAGGALIWHGADLFSDNLQSSTGNSLINSLSIAFLLPKTFKQWVL